MRHEGYQLTCSVLLHPIHRFRPTGQDLVQVHNYSLVVGRFTESYETHTRDTAMVHTLEQQTSRNQGKMMVLDKDR